MHLRYITTKFNSEITIKTVAAHLQLQSSSICNFFSLKIRVLLGHHLEFQGFSTNYLANNISLRSVQTNVKKRPKNLCEHSIVHVRWVLEMKSPACGPRLGPNVYTTMWKKRNLRGWEKRKRKGICGDGFQRFEPNLPLPERGRDFIPQDCRRRNLYYGFTHDSRSQVCQSRANTQKWKADSASMEDAPQVGLGLSPILWKWLFRQQCPVISETKTMSFRDKFSKYFVTLNSGCEIHCRLSATRNFGPITRMCLDLR
jgi:hypothetical protein